jgi:hypothetical protein
MNATTPSLYPLSYCYESSDVPLLCPNGTYTDNATYGLKEAGQYSVIYSTGSTAFAEIFLCLNSVDQLKVEPTGQVTFTCPVPVGSIRQDTRSMYIAQRNGYSFSGQVEMKRAEIWFHMKKVPIYEDINMYKASIF